MDFFVKHSSVVRQIWGKSDTILFIFAGAAAEFALNRAVDWLYFTGRLPADPLGRLFSTVGYARLIIFTSTEGAHRAIDKMRDIHSGVEAARGSTIPDWAYRDVLFMLIYYSISAFEVLERPLQQEEKEEVFDVFYRVGHRMGLQGLPQTYSEWLPMRAAHLEQDLVKSHYTKDLFRQYKKHLGSIRYRLLLEGQKLVVPQKVKTLLDMSGPSLLSPVLQAYKLGRKVNLDGLLKELILPPAYKKQIKALDVSK
ncbi:oxygenase MpaB family protein [Paraflavisolibacter sp. H34]|uniref:oxygenase MpaB family protein n=1 Tax=Huijunlia imazamoxiresistens TaxID=3127457 RepID=UPI003019978F